MMRMVALVFSLGSLVLEAQTAVELFKKAPPAVDEALRARVNEFYQYHVDKKFRKADALVAEESKDTFYAALKQEPLSFRINEIQYEENFSKARVMTLLKVERGIPYSAGLVRMDMPVQTYWKVIDGQWFFYLPERPCRPTPMGPCRAFTPEELEAAKNQVVLKEAVDKAMADAKAGRFANWEFSEKSVVLNREAGAEAVITLKNNMNGYLTLDLYQYRQQAILSAVIEDGKIGPGKEARIRVKVVDAGAFSRQIVVPVVVNPFNEVVQLNFSPK